MKTCEKCREKSYYIVPSRDGRQMCWECAKKEMEEKDKMFKEWWEKFKKEAK